MLEQVDLVPVQDTTFDYSVVDNQKLARLKVLADKGRTHLRRTREEIIAFGDVLIEAKALLPHGQFREWAYVEFGIPDSTITYAMRLARGGGVIQKIEKIEADGVFTQNVNISILPEQAESKQDDLLDTSWEDITREDISGLTYEELIHRVDIIQNKSCIEILETLLTLVQSTLKHGKSYHDLYCKLADCNQFIFISELDYMRLIATAQEYHGRYRDMPNKLAHDIFNILWAEDYMGVLLMGMEKLQETKKDTVEFEYKGRWFIYGNLEQVGLRE